MPMTAPYVRAPLSRLDDLAESYHENTKIRAYMRDASDDPTGARLDLPPVESLSYAPDAPIALPPPASIEAPLSQVFAKRRSARSFDGAALRDVEVATILAHAYGRLGEGRAAPSAGARYPLELFVIAQRVEGLAPGVWHYRPESHEAEVWPEDDAWARASRALFEQPLLAGAAAILVIGAVFGRTSVKYGERGYRLVLLDAGHAMQNALLAATGLGLAACPLGGFVDDEMNALVGLDGIGENVVYACALGRSR